MDHYESTLDKIHTLIKEEKINEALNIIEDELKAPYLPKEFNDELDALYAELRPVKDRFIFNDDDLREYLKGTNEKQLLAVDQLNKKNLREYIDLCNEYLCSDGYLNAKVLLVDSLIRQEIGDYVRMEDKGIEYEFIPKYLLPVEESDAYLAGEAYINEAFLKEPSKAKIAMDLLYKDLILSLPLNKDEDEGQMIAKDIESYVNKAFEG